MQLFYIPGISGNIVTLDQTESKHAIKVLRLSKGDQVQIIDGKGGFYNAEILEDDHRGCKLSVLSSTKRTGEKKFKLHIAIAPTKNTDRFEWFLEKATEIGISEITPLVCDHSERKTIKPERLEKILVSAMKQSLKAYLPKLNKITPLKDFVHRATAGRKFIAHCHEGEKKHLKDTVPANTDVLVLIGPEGDFSAGEVDMAKKLGFMEISLGSSRLRTETAGVAACHIVNLANE